MHTLSALVLLMITGQAVIFSMLAFMNGQLLPGLLAPAYAALSPLARLLILVPLAAIPANWLFATGYRIAGPGTAGVAYVLTAVGAMVITAMLIDGARPNPQIAAGALVMATGAVIVVRGLATA